jgi:hypothetical protein
VWKKQPPISDSGLEKTTTNKLPKKKTQFRILVWKNTHKEESQRKEKKSQEKAAAEEENKKMCNKEVWQTSSIYESDDGTAALAGTGFEGG